MEFKTTQSYTVTDVLKPKSVYVKELEVSVGDILEFNLV